MYSIQFSLNDQSAILDFKFMGNEGYFTTIFFVIGKHRAIIKYENFNLTVKNRNFEIEITNNSSYDFLKIINVEKELYVFNSINKTNTP